MSETNPTTREAAASSPSPYLSEGMLRAQANPCCAFPAAVQVLSREVLRMRAQCPPTAEVEQMRAELATAKDDVKRLRDEKRDQIAATVEHLRRAGIIVGAPTAGPTPGVAIGEPMTLASTIGMLCDERAKILAGLGREAKALLEASFMLACAEGGRTLPDPRVEETFGIFGALRRVIAERDEARRIAEQNSKAATERGDWLEAAAKAVGCKPQDLPKECASREKMLVAFMHAGRLLFGVDIEPQMLALAAEVEEFRSSAHRDACMTFDTFLRRCGIDVSKLEGLMPVRWVIEAAKLLREPVVMIGGSLPDEARTAVAAVRDLGPELAKAGIQVGPRLSHAEAVAQLRGERDRWREKCEAAHQLVDEAARFEGAVVADLATHGFFAAGGLGGVRLAVGKALAELNRLRKESKRDQVTKQQALLDEIARLLPGKGPLLERVKHAAKMVEQDAIAERLCKELDLNPEKVWLEAMRKTQPKRDVALAPIKGFVDEAIRKVVERASKDGGLPAFGDPLGLFTRRSLPTKEKIPGDWCGTNRPEAPPLEPRPDLGDALNFGLKYPRSQPKVGPATGQPRTEAPAGATLVDGAGVRIPLVETDGGVDIAEDLRGPHERCTVTMDPTGKKVVGFKTRMDLGDRFRESMDFADPDFFAITALLNGETHDQSRHRHLHTAVAELAKVVERIGGAK